MTLPKGVRMSVTGCAAHKHRELVPVETHHIWPLGYDGPDSDWNKVVLCENAHGSVHSLLDLMLKAEKQGKTVPWITRRQYGRKIRAFAQEGFVRIQLSRQGLE